MASTAEQIRAYRGPALWSHGFRPFFLFGAVWAALALAVWLPMLSGALVIPTAFAPLEWHVHELLFGYVPAIVAGFLLTAVPNWTERLPVTGTPLIALFLLWVVGRIAVMTSQLIGVWPAAVLDLTFLLALASLIGREILAAGNTRNLKVLALVGLLFIANLVFHAEARLGGGHGYATRMGLGATLVLIMVIGGRIIPSFTRNWLVRRGPGRLPTPFDTFDIAIITASTVALVLWVAAPDNRITAIACLIAGIANLARLARWAGWRTTSEPLVLILHTAYIFVPVGFLLVALGIWRSDVVSPSGALHGWTAGAVAPMTLAVMTRASLGHTGQPLTATPAITLIYIAALISALARVIAAFGLARDLMLAASVLAWMAAFLGFAVVYAPLLLRRA